MAKSILPRLCVILTVVILAVGYGYLQDQNGNVLNRDRNVGGKTIQLDRFGDPLPHGAVTRLGTLRWRPGTAEILFSPDGDYFVTRQTPPRVYDAHTGRFLHSIDTHSNHLHFSEDSRELFAFEFPRILPNPPILRCWDVRTGRQRRQFPVNGWWTVWSGNFLATVFYDNQIYKNGISIWDLVSGKKLATLYPPELPGAFAMVPAPNGKTLAVCYGKRLYLLDTRNGKTLRSTPIEIPDSTSFAPKFTPDSNTVVFLDDGQVCAWDFVTDDNVRRLEFTTGRLGVIEIPKGRIHRLEDISRDGRYLAGTGDGLHLWDLHSGKLLQRIRDTDLHGENLFALLGNGEPVAGKSPFAHLFRRWDIISGKELLTEIPDTAVNRMTFSPDGKRVTAMYHWRRTGPNSTNQDFVIWDIASAKPVHFTQKSDPRQIENFVSSENLISPNQFRGMKGLQFPTCSPDGKTIPVVYVGAVKRSEGPRKDDPRQRINNIHGMMIGFWDLHEEKNVRSFEIDVNWSSERARGKDDQGLQYLVLSPDRKLLAGRAEYSSVFVWDLTTGVELRRWSLRGYPSPGRNPIAFTSDGKALISLRYHWQMEKTSLSLHFHDLATGQERAKADCAIEIAAGQAMCGPVFAGDRLAAVAVGNTVYLLDPMTGATLREFKGHLEDVTGLAFSPDRRFLASGSADTTILIWQVGST